MIKTCSPQKYRGNPDRKPALKTLNPLVLGEPDRPSPDQICVNLKVDIEAGAGSYEVRADKGKARLMFFYDERDEMMVICTNGFWKGSGQQDTAFKHCNDFKNLYFRMT